MRIGISSFTYTWAVGVAGRMPDKPVTAYDLIDRAHALNVSVVQIADNIPLHLWSDKELADLKRHADMHSITIEAGSRGCRQEHLRHMMDVAHALGSTILRIVVDSSGDEPDETEIVRRIQAVVPHLHDQCVTLAVENHDRLSTAFLKRIIESVNDPHCGICLDTVNSFGSLEGSQVVLDALAPHTVNLHVKDFYVRRHSHNMGLTIEGTPAGAGRLDIPAIFKRLDFCRASMSAILELWTPPEESLAKTIEKERVWAEQSIDYLRRLV